MLIRIINTIIILLLIDFFGIIPENSLSKITVDALLLSMTFYIVIRKKNKANYTETFIKALFIFFSIVAAYTYFQGGSNLVDIYKFYRIYFPLLLVIPLMYDINYSNIGFKYYRKLFQVIAVSVTVMLIMMSVFHVEFFSTWPRLTYDFQDGDYIDGLKRVYIYSSFTFPIIEFIFLVYSLFLGIKVNRLLFTIITLGFLLQGFRSYILATILIIGVSIFFYLSNKQGVSVWSIIRKNFIILSVGLFVGFTFLGSRIASGVSDFINVSGTFGSRILLDAFRLKVFSENLFFGVGFLHNDALRAKQMGVTSSEELRSALTESNYDVLQESAIYSLRATDSGYLDLLVQFGIVGVILFMLIYFNFYFKLGKIIKLYNDKTARVHILSLRATLLVFIFTLISHAGITNIYGLLPIAFALSFAQCQINRESFL